MMIMKKKKVEKKKKKVEKKKKKEEGRSWWKGTQEVPQPQLVLVTGKVLVKKRMTTIKVVLDSYGHPPQKS